MPGGGAGLELMAGNDRAAILDEQVRNRFGRDSAQTGFFDRFAIRRKLLNLLGERAGARTRDPAE
jgi:hypothetical protein